MVSEKLRLSPRQVEVALLCLDELCEDDIAARLQISVHTVHHHFKKIYEKLGVTSRIGMTVSIVSVIMRNAHSTALGMDEP